MTTLFSRLLAASAVIGAALIPASAIAQEPNTRTYFTARIATSEVPQQLSASDREHYRAVFQAIERNDWTTVESLLNQRPDGLLTDVARAQYYLDAESPRIELPALLDWLNTGRELPQAEAIGRLSTTRGAASAPNLPYARELVGQSAMPRRNRPRSVDDGTMPGSIRSAILERITNDDPDGARVLLDGVDSALSSEARAEWRARVAWSYFIENRDAEALARLGGQSLQRRHADCGHLQGHGQTARRRNAATAPVRS